MPDRLKCSFRINNRSTYHFMLRSSVGGETTAIHIHERESLAGAFWPALLIIAGWGGFVRYPIDMRQSKATWSWINALTQIVVLGFAGVIGDLISIGSGFSIYMILVTAGISDAMGSVTPTYFWERLTGVKNTKS